MSPPAIASPSTILITGASSGIGAALARLYARPGVRLGLIARDAARLEAVALAAEAAGATCERAAIDVTDRVALAAWIEAFDDGAPVDLVIAGAGILDGRRDGETVETIEAARHVIAVNLLGTLDTIHPLLPRFRARGRGQVAMIASLAALSPLPDAPAYGASKAALLSYGLALRSALRGQGVGVSIACPGYVTTGMTAQHLGHRPGEMDADSAARLIAQGLARGREIIGFPAGLYWLSRLSIVAPEFVRRFGMKDLRFTVRR